MFCKVKQIHILLFICCNNYPSIDYIIRTTVLQAFLSDSGRGNRKRHHSNHKVCLVVLKSNLLFQAKAKTVLTILIKVVNSNSSVNTIHLLLDYSDCLFLKIILNEI